MSHVTPIGNDAISTTKQSTIFYMNVCRRDKCSYAKGFPWTYLVTMNIVWNVYWYEAFKWDNYFINQLSRITQILAACTNEISYWTKLASCNICIMIYLHVYIAWTIRFHDRISIQNGSVFRILRFYNYFRTYFGSYWYLRFWNWLNHSMSSDFAKNI